MWAVDRGMGGVVTGNGNGRRPWGPATVVVRWGGATRVGQLSPSSLESSATPASAEMTVT
jgi:hypothetical protein